MAHQTDDERSVYALVVAAGSVERAGVHRPIAEATVAARPSIGRSSQQGPAQHAGTTGARSPRLVLGPQDCDEDAMVGVLSALRFAAGSETRLFLVHQVVDDGWAPCRRSQVSRTTRS